MRCQYDDYQKKNVLTVAKEQKENLLNLAKDFPRLWNSPSTSSKDKKRILRLLIKDITVEKFKEKNMAILHIRWQGGALESLEVSIPRPSHERWKHPEKLINRIKDLSATLTCSEIAEVLNQEGLKSNKGNAFTEKSISWIRHKYLKDLKFIKKTKPRILSHILKKPHEFTLQEAMEKLNVSYYVIHYWIERKIVKARQIGSKMWIIELDEQKERELRQKIESSTKILKAREKSQNNKIERGVL